MKWIIIIIIIHFIWGAPFKAPKDPLRGKTGQTKIKIRKLKIKLKTVVVGKEQEV